MAAAETFEAEVFEGQKVRSWDRLGIVLLGWRDKEVGVVYLSCCFSSSPEGLL